MNFNQLFRGNLALVLALLAMAAAGCASATNGDKGGNGGPGGKADDGNGNADGGDGDAGFYDDVTNAGPVSFVALDPKTGTISRYDAGSKTTTLLATVPHTTVAYDLGGTIYVENVDESSDTAAPQVGKVDGNVVVPLVTADGTPVNTSYLIGVSSVLGSRNLLLNHFPLETDEDGNGAFSFFNVTTNLDTNAGYARGPEYFVTRASYGGGRFLLSASADLSELVSFTDLAGNPIEGLHSPTDDLPYNSAPYVHQAVISPDGTKIAYLEAPETNYQTEQMEVVGSWAVVLFDVATGAKTRAALPDWGVDAVAYLDFDGSTIVVSAPEKTSPQFFETASGTPVLSTTQWSDGLILVTFPR